MGDHIDDPVRIVAPIDPTDAFMDVVAQELEFQEIYLFAGNRNPILRQVRRATATTISVANFAGGEHETQQAVTLAFLHIFTFQALFIDFFHAEELGASEVANVAPVESRGA